MCCKNDATIDDCDSSKWPKGEAFGAMLRFAGNEARWISTYTFAWWLATENGYTQKETI